MNGTLYGVGVGPGDPELLTLKAARMIRECPVIAVPQTGDSRRVAMQIAERAVGGLEEKEVLALPFPMTKNLEQLERNRDKAAEQIASFLSTGKDVAFLTLGDPTVYSTYLYLHQRILSKGFSAHIIPGVPSFCAAAARLNEGLAQADQMLHIVPASYEDTAHALSFPGTKVLMKMGKNLEAVAELIEQQGLSGKARMVQNCGMEEERIYESLTNIEVTPSYFSMIVIKEE